MVDPSDPLRSLRANSSRVMLKPSGALGEATTAPVAAGRGETLTGAAAVQALVQWSLSQLGTLPSGFHLGCEDCAFWRPIGLDELVDLVGQAQTDGNRSVVL